MLLFIYAVPAQTVHCYNICPKIAECYIKAFDKMLENMPDKSKLSWKNGTEVMDRWLYGNKETDENQISFDDL